MGFLENLENRLEGAVSKLFARVSRSELQPVEIVDAVRRAMDQSANRLDRDRVLVANEYLVRVAPSDFDRISSPGLVKAITVEASKHAVSQGYRMGGELEMRVRSDSSVPRGQVKIDATSAANQISWVAALIVGDQRFELKLGTTTVGRAEGGADLAIDDRGLSRIHFEIAFNGEVAALRDRQSTNGTFIDGVRINDAVLRSGTKIEAGRTEFEFELSAIQAKPEADAGGRA
jgi:hypothetical protein